MPGPNARDHEASDRNHQQPAESATSSTSGIQQGRRRSRSVPVEHDSRTANSVSPGCALPSDKEAELSSPEPDICSGKGPVIRTILDSYQATVGLLDLAGGLFRPAGLQIPEAPTLSGGTDTTSLSADDAAMKDFIAVLTIAADSLWDAKHVTAGTRCSSQHRKLSIGFFIGSAAS